MKPLMTVKEAAEYLHLSQKAVYHNAKIGNIPCVRIGRTVRFSQEALDAFACPAAPETPEPRHNPVTRL